MMKLYKWPVKRCLLAFVLLASISVCFSQNGIIESRLLFFEIIDSAKYKPVEGATVTLTSTASSAEFRALTDSSGVCSVNVTVPELDSLKIKVSHVGYKLYDNNIAAANIKSYNRFQIKLHQVDSSMVSVVVMGGKRIVEDQGDKIIYNAEYDIANAAGDATDILRRTPLVTVDMNGNASIRGSSSIKILINGKPVNNQSSSQIIKQIPGYLVKSVEVITNPSAKYESEGATGIINIITTKKILLGTSGSINSGIGSKGSHLFGIINYNKKKTSLSIGTGNYWFYTRSSGYTNAMNEINGKKSTFFEQRFNGNYNGSTNNIQAQGSYTINDKSSFNVEITRSQSKVNPDQNYNLQYFSLLTGLPSTSLVNRLIESSNTSISNNINCMYDIKSSKSQRALNILLSGIFYDNKNNYSFHQINSDYTIFEKNSNPALNREYNLQLNYEHPVSNKKHFFETGFKAVNRRMESNYNLDQDSINLAGLATSKFSANSFLNYNQQIYALYLSDKYRIGTQLSVRLGVRYETVRNLLRDSTNFTGIKNTYSNLFPNLGFVWSASTTSTLSINYNYRVQRPTIDLLNPAINSQDAISVYSGNPKLLPEYSHNFELSLSQYLNNNYFKFSPYCRVTSDLISKITKIDSGYFRTFNDNVGQEIVLGVNVWSTINITKKWLLSCGEEINHSNITNTIQNISNKGWRLSTSFNTSYKISESIMMQFFGVYYTPKILLQGKESSYYYNNLAVRKEFNNKRSSIAVSIDNAFSKAFKFKIENRIYTFSSYDETLFYNRGIRIMFNHRFGNSNTMKSRKKILIEQDLKDKENSMNQSLQDF